MSTFGLLQMHENVVQSKGNYCCICFRPALERKVVEPVHLSLLISKLEKVTLAFFKEKIKVCYICEALALSAVRFIKAVEIAAEINGLFKFMDRKQWTEISKHLESPDQTPKVVKRDTALSRALRIDKSLRAEPRYELRRTDTLVVPSRQLRRETMVMMEHDNPIHTVMPVMPMMTPLVPMVPSVSQAPLAPPVPTVAPPVPTMAPSPRSANPKISVLLDQMQVKVANSPNDFILHPMVQGLDGKIYVPSLQLQIQENGTISSAPNLDTILPPALMANPTNNQTINQSNNTLLRRTFIPRVYSIDRDTMHQISNYHNIITSQKEQKKQQNNTEVIKMNDLNIVLNSDEEVTKKKRKWSDHSTEQTLSDVKLILNENAQGGCDIKYEIIDDDDPLDVATKAEEESTNKGPVLMTDRTVDWEDKIPMDVISFMDATDPNPQERIMQPPPMAVISDVRSMPNEPVECIDLS